MPKLDPDHPILKNLGKRLRYLRKQKDLTLRELAKEFDCSFTNINHWENGRLCPSVYHLVLYAEMFKVSLDEILGLKKSDGINL